MGNTHIPRNILPEGNFFGDIEDDEFNINLDGQEAGVFKRFEYLSPFFSASGRDDLFREVLENAESNQTSFAEELESHEEAKHVIENTFERMEENPNFTKEVMDNLLADIYVEDNIIAEIPAEDNIEQEIGKFTAGWKQLADFYGIEGLVGGDGEEYNPFLEDQGGSMAAGSLDSLETVLPTLRNNLSDREWDRTRLKLSSVVGRDHQHIEHATNVLEHIHGLEDYSQDFLESSQDLIDELSHTEFTSNIEHGKFYNTFIRFHNWMPLNILEDGPQGDQYDSICQPAKDSMASIEGTSLHDSLSDIGDATSPKGLTMAWLLDENHEIDGEPLGNRKEFDEAERYFQQQISEEIESRKNNFATIELEDPVMYSGLTGGKWKGLKLLNDSKDVFNLDYKIPEGRNISSKGAELILEETGVQETIEDNMFSMDESSRQEIVQAIQNVDVDEYFDLEDGTILRSSMYGEDGTSNFAGTYESFVADENPEAAFKDVIASYFSERAVKAREDKGLTHNGAISVIEQELIDPERGGVVHLTEDSYSVSEADDAEKAVEGEGDSYQSDDIGDLVEETSLESMEADLRELHEIFGDIDLEYVWDGEDVYLTQMRPKHEISREEQTDFESYERLTLESIDEIYNCSIDNGKEYVVEMEFLGRENIMDRVGDLNKFIRENEGNISGVSGNMPRVAHIPNNIESHFQIPYKEME